MRTGKRCRLCGREIPPDRYNDCQGMDCDYCDDLCYLTDSILPPVEDTSMLFGLSEKILRIRYDIMVSGERDPIYKSDFEEEEDQLMQEDG